MLGSCIWCGSGILSDILSLFQGGEGVMYSIANSTGSTSIADQLAIGGPLLLCCFLRSASYSNICFSRFFSPSTEHPPLGGPDSTWLRRVWISKPSPFSSSFSGPSSGTGGNSTGPLPHQSQEAVISFFHRSAWTVNSLRWAHNLSRRGRPATPF